MRLFMVYYWVFRYKPIVINGGTCPGASLPDHMSSCYVVMYEKCVILEETLNRLLSHQLLERWKRREVKTWHRIGNGGNIRKNVPTRPTYQDTVIRWLLVFQLLLLAWSNLQRNGSWPVAERPVTSHAKLSRCKREKPGCCCCWQTCARAIRGVFCVCTDVHSPKFVFDTVHFFE